MPCNELSVRTFHLIGASLVLVARMKLLGWEGGEVVGEGSGQDLDSKASRGKAGLRGSMVQDAVGGIRV